MTPKVSVLMAVYNGSAYLPEAVESILSQTFTDFEFVIVDDGSTDDTGVILSKYARSDSRVKVLSNPQNAGLTRSLNRGLHAASGTYVARQDADDISVPTRFEKEVEVLENDPAIVLVSGNQQYIDPDGTFLFTTQLHAAPDVIAWKLLFYNHVGGHSGVMFRRELVDAMGGYAEDHRLGQDYELWLRLSRQGDLWILPDVVLLHRVHPNSVSSQSRLEQEALSLVDSGRALSELLGRGLEMREVLGLRQFWTDGIDDNSDLLHVNRLLIAAFEAFTCKRKAGSGERTVPADGLRRVIAERYEHWARVASKRCKPVTAMRRVRLAFSWYPPGVSPRRRMRALRDQLWLLRHCLARKLHGAAGRLVTRTADQRTGKG